MLRTIPRMKPQEDYASLGLWGKRFFVVDLADRLTFLGPRQQMSARTSPGDDLAVPLSDVKNDQCIK
jgi:hypothetical protein